MTVRPRPWRAVTAIAASSGGLLSLLMPRPLLESAGADAWLAAALGVGLALSVAWASGELARRFPGQNPVDYAPDLLGAAIGRAGRSLGALIGLAYGVFFALVAAVVLRLFGELLTVAFLPGMSIWLALPPLMLLVGWLARGTLDDVARISELAVPVGILGVAVMLAFGIPYYSADRLRPLLAEGWQPVVASAPLHASFVTGFGAIVLVGPRLCRREWALPAHAAAVLLQGALLTGLTAAAVATFGPWEGARMAWPGFELARMVRLSQFIERAEALLLAAWLGATVVQLALFTRLASEGMAAIGRLVPGVRAAADDPARPWVAPAAIAIFLTGVIPRDALLGANALRWLGHAAWAVQLAIPALLLSFAGAARRRPQGEAGGAGGGRPGGASREAR